MIQNALKAIQNDERSALQRINESGGAALASIASLGANSRCAIGASADFPELFVVTVVSSSGYWAETKATTTKADLASFRYGRDYTEALPAGVGLDEYLADGDECSVASDGTIWLAGEGPETATPPPAGSISSDADGQISGGYSSDISPADSGVGGTAFRSPSGNIVCSEAGGRDPRVECYVISSRTLASLSSTKATVESDVALPSYLAFTDDPGALGYGSSWTSPAAPNLRCASASTGVTCRVG